VNFVAGQPSNILNPEVLSGPARLG
jgi:hypothetical protein